MVGTDQLQIPDTTGDEANAPEGVRRVADAIAAFAADGQFLSPRRFQAAIRAAEEAGRLFNEPAIMQVLVLRAISSRVRARAALAALKPVITRFSATERLSLMRVLKPLVGEDANPAIAALAIDLAATLDVAFHDFRHDGTNFYDALKHRARRLVHPEAPIVAAARESATDFGESQLLTTIARMEGEGDKSQLDGAILLALDEVRSRVAAVAKAMEHQEEARLTADELDKIADKLEREARQRDVAILRRATMLKRHIREDLNALVEDAVEEFESDFRRLDEKKRRFFGNLDTTDLNERNVIKNLERRYRNLAQRYNEQLDLFDREVYEYCNEFTRIGDEALSPIARYEFRNVVPHPTFEQRVKSAVDRASTKTLYTGAVGAAVSGAAIGSGLPVAGAIVGIAVMPVGAAVLAAVALAGVWKIFASPSERRKRDVRDRSRTLEDLLREEMMRSLPRFEQTVDAVVGRFQKHAVADILPPRRQATRIREIASTYRVVAQGVVEAANTRIDRLLCLMAKKDPGIPE